MELWRVFCNLHIKLQVMNQLFSLVVALVCSATLMAQTTLHMTIRETAQPCQRMMPQECLQVKIDGAKEWELFYDKIYGFDYVPGYQYELKVVRTERPAHVPQDLSKYIYKLEAVVSQTLVPLAVANTTYRVVRLNGKKPMSEELTLSINAERTQLSCNLGCNRMTIPITWNKHKTKLSILTSGKQLMECDETHMALEKEMLAALNNKKMTVSTQANYWIWSVKKMEILALEMVTETEQPAQVIQKPERTPMDYFNGKALKVIYLNGQKTPTNSASITFDQQNQRFFGSSGCNQINGGFQLAGQKSTFTNVVSTKMACLDEETQLLERGIMQVLHQPNLTVDFAEQVMTFYDEHGNPILMLAVSK